MKNLELTCKFTIREELERLFVQALELMGNDKRTVHIEKALINSKEGYFLNVGDCAWEIEPQVLLDERYGVTVKTRADLYYQEEKQKDRNRLQYIQTDFYIIKINVLMIR